MNAKTEQKEQSRQSILASAARFVRTRGIARASVAEVMKGAGLTVGGFYAHFDSKQALVDETLKRTAAELREQLFAGIDDKPQADRALVVLKRYLSKAHRDADSLGCPFPAVVGEVGTSAPEHGPAVADALKPLVTKLAEQVPQQGEVTPRVIALGLVALMYGGLSLARAVKGTAFSDEILHACRTVGALVSQSRDR